MTATLFVPLFIAHWFNLGLAAQSALMVLCMFISLLLFRTFSAKPLANKVHQMTMVIQTLAEGDGNLRQR
jgi:FtsH-binding integral membrane protein